MNHRLLLATALTLAVCLSACSRSESSGGAARRPDGTWAGALDAQGTALRLEVHIKTDKGGGLTAEMVSLDQGNVRIPVNTISIENGEMAFSIVQIAGSYRGTLNEQGSAVIGTWSQLGNDLPLTLKKQ